MKDKNERLNKIENIMNVGLEPSSMLRFHEFSGGQRQRIASKIICLKSKICLVG